jgi:hypothetical protein
MGVGREVGTAEKFENLSVYFCYLNHHLIPPVKLSVFLICCWFVTGGIGCLADSELAKLKKAKPPVTNTTIPIAIALDLEL